MKQETRFNLSVANRLAEVRGCHGWSVTDLAGRSGVSTFAIRAIEIKNAAPTMRTALLLAYALDVPVEDLFFLEVD